jgi:hypothetical protein
MKTENYTGEPVIAAKREVAEIGWFEWGSLPDPLFLPLQNLLKQRGFAQEGLTKSRV